MAQATRPPAPPPAPSGSAARDRSLNAPALILADPALWGGIARCEIDLSHLPGERQAMLRGQAWAILRLARARRTGTDPEAIRAPSGPAAPVLPLAQVRRPTRHRLTIQPPTGPGDAA